MQDLPVIVRGSLEIASLFIKFGGSEKEVDKECLELVSLCLGPWDIEVLREKISGVKVNGLFVERNSAFDVPFFVTFLPSSKAGQEIVQVNVAELLIQVNEVGFEVDVG